MALTAAVFAMFLGTLLIPADLSRVEVAISSAECQQDPFGLSVALGRIRQCQAVADLCFCKGGFQCALDREA